ncbi:MAG: CvpA family protein [Candidatus Eremiobacteraeota bacterium]|nr:CvpA family protein [Candidatus Eremiobacteraeota bacterium]
MSVVWPDIVIAAIVLIAVIKGFRRGFVSELSGAIAFFAALATPWFYNGFADGQITSVTHLARGSAHVIGMVLIGIATYVLVLLLAWLLNGIAKLPILNIGNSLAGAAVGFIKSAVFLWLVLYIVLFFPLSPDIRHDLHRSQLVAYLIQPDKRIDNAISSTLPWFARPFAHPYFARHQV